MNPLLIIPLVAVGALFGVAWHNQPARSPYSVESDEWAANQAHRVNWGMVVIWSLVFLSIAALLLAGGIAWAKHSSAGPASHECKKRSLASPAVQSNFPSKL